MLTAIGRNVPRMGSARGCQIFHMKEKRVSGVGTGGTRRHDDPPSWMDISLPLEKRRLLLDRAIKLIGRPRHDGAGPSKDKK